MIRCLAVDDEPLALRQLVGYISKIPYLELAAECQSAVEARAFLQEEAVDAIFCDINMPDLDGMDFIKSLPAPPLVVFTTAYAEYAVDGFRVGAVDYLLKPFSMQDFLEAAERLKERLSSRFSGEGGKVDSPLAQPATIFLKTDYRTVRVRIGDIRYVEAMSEYLKVFVEGEAKPVVTLLSLKKLQQHLPDGFMRIHRSYIVNLDKIREVGKNHVVMEGDVRLPVGDVYRESFRSYLDARSIGD